MKKQAFLDAVSQRLSGFPKQEVEDHLGFYSEMIDDRIECGMSEDEAVDGIGTVDEVVAQIIADGPFSKIARERIKPKRQLRAWEILLLILGSPIWVSLLIAVAAVIFSLYISLWALVVSLWSIFASLAACSVGGVSSCVALALGGNGVSGVAMLAAGFTLAGLSIFTFYGCRSATTCAVTLTKKLAIGIKNCFVKKEVAE